MIIEETNIPNVTKDNLDISKQILADNIIKNIYPLFNEVYTLNVEKIELSKKDLNQKKKLVQENKSELENLMNEYKIKKKVNKLLERIEKLITSGLVYDGTLKNETIVLLKVANKLPEEKIDYHLRELLQTISKRFAR